MGNKRPRIKVPLETIDVVIEMVSVSILSLMWIHVIVEYTSLPEIIASHFNGKGQPDGYSNKLFVWFLPSLATATYVGLFVLNKYPHLHNYMVNINEENALVQYRFSTRILRVVNLLTALLFGYINYKIIEGAKHNASDLGIGFLITVITVSIALPVFILVYQSKLNKKNRNV